MVSVSLLAVLDTEYVARFCIKAERVSRFDPLPIDATTVSMGKKVFPLRPTGF